MSSKDTLLYKVKCVGPDIEKIQVNYAMCSQEAVERSGQIRGSGIRLLANPGSATYKLWDFGQDGNVFGPQFSIFLIESLGAYG